MGLNEIQYISDKKGETTAVVVPINIWRNIETNHFKFATLNLETIERTHDHYVNFDHKT